MCLWSRSRMRLKLVRVPSTQRCFASLFGIVLIYQFPHSIKQFLWHLLYPTSRCVASTAFSFYQKRGVNLPFWLKVLLVRFIELGSIVWLRPVVLVTTMKLLVDAGLFTSTGPQQSRDAFPLFAKKTQLLGIITCFSRRRNIYFPAGPQSKGKLWVTSVIGIVLRTEKKVQICSQ